MLVGVAAPNRRLKLQGQNPILSVLPGSPGAILFKIKNQTKIGITGVRIPGEPHGVVLGRRLLRLLLPLRVLCPLTQGHSGVVDLDHVGAVGGTSGGHAQLGCGPYRRIE